MKFTIVKRLDNTFIGAFDTDNAKIKKLKVGDLLVCDIKKPRNYEFHKKFFALINMIFDNQEIYKDLDDLRRDLTIEAGYYDTYINIHGEEVKKAKSISFYKMEEHNFQEFYTAVVDKIVLHFNFNKDDIIENVARYF